jgi:thiol:disulfide interchange protein DsbD
MVTYAAMGALAGETGDQLQAYFQNAWAIGFLSGLFFIMALAMFGLFEFQMPGFIQSRIQSGTGSMGGSVPLVFALGLFSALIIGACVSPVLVSFLGIAMTSQDPVLGAQLMLAMALGMGIPLILLGIGAGHFIPRAGQWMVKVRQGFGVMLIAVSIYLLSLLPDIPILLLWGGFFIILSVFLGTTERSPKNMTMWQRLEKGAGIILLVWGIILIVGGLFGERNIFRPLPDKLIFSNMLNPGTEAAKESFQFIRVDNVSQLEQQLSRARQQQKLVMIDYYADWCVECIRMEETTFTDPGVISILDRNFISLQVDVTDPNDDERKALKQAFNVFGPPATLFLDRDGNILTDANFYGYMDNQQFISLISSL